MEVAHHINSVTRVPWSPMESRRAPIGHAQPIKARRHGRPIGKRMRAFLIGAGAPSGCRDFTSLAGGDHPAECERRQA
eukprot:5579720-Alexandrium_andersonii.AAC.1